MAEAELRRFFERIPEIETNRLIMRGFQEADLDSWSEICADPEVIRYASLAGKPLTRAQAWNWLTAMLGHWHLRGYGMWALKDKATGALIGRVGLQYPEGYPGVEIAWMLARNYWGKGLASEAALHALRWGFRNLDQETFISLIFPENTRSIRLAERLGESFVGDYQIGEKRLRQYRISRDLWESR